MNEQISGPVIVSSVVENIACAINSDTVKGGSKASSGSWVLDRPGVESAVSPPYALKGDPGPAVDKQSNVW
jgi:hypothetical protein